MRRSGGRIREGVEGYFDGLGRDRSRRFPGCSGRVGQPAGGTEQQASLQRLKQEPAWGGRQSAHHGFGPGPFAHETHDERCIGGVTMDYADLD